MQLRTEVEIECAPDRVWQVLSDVRRYGEWNPFIKSIEGELQAGARLNVIETPPDGSERSYRATLLRIEPGRELRWAEKAWLGGLFDVEHFVLLTPRDGTTRVVNGGDYEGFLVKYRASALRQIANGLVGMNEALKRRIERVAPR